MDTRKIEPVTVDYKRHLGRFRIPQQWVWPEKDVDQNALDTIGKLFKNMVILKCENKFYMNSIEYEGYSPFFSVVKEGDAIPEYHVVLERDGTARFDISN